MKQNDNNGHTENLLQIPKLSSLTGFTPPYISLGQEMAGINQSNNSYNFLSKFKSHNSEKPLESLLIKQYDSYVGETKDESYSNPTHEARDDQN
jgi:hypothetical protein